MRFRKLHELTPWTERTIQRLREGRKLQGNHSSEDWQRLFKQFQRAPDPPLFRVALSPDSIVLDPAGPAGQLELGVAVARLSNLRISNAKDSFDPRLPFRLMSLIGADAFTRAHSWWRRTYPQRLVIARADQRYPEGWDELCRLLAEDPDRDYSVRELADLSRRAIGVTLDPAEAARFWAANR